MSAYTIDPFGADECPHGLGMPQACQVCNGYVAQERIADAQERRRWARLHAGRAERERAEAGTFTGARWASASGRPQVLGRTYPRVSARDVHGRA